MNREIEFRGMTFDNKFIYGDFVRGAFDGTSLKISTGIIKENCYPVYVKPETVGQYTGLKDKNEVKIFEGDILQLKSKKHGEHFAVVVFEAPGFKMNGNKSIFKDHALNIGVVSGNIHENKDLLK